MNLLQNRNETGDDILKGRFIRKVLSEASADIDKAQREYMASRGFNNGNGWHDRSFSVTDNALDYEHLKKHRFVDMRTRTADDGSKRAKKSHPIHNRIIFGHYNNVVRELSFGFTEGIKNQLRNLDE